MPQIAVNIPDDVADEIEPDPGRLAEQVRLALAARLYEEAEATWARGPS
ncbi:MAG: hypothetical protein HY744_22910 [Deltaproteobacteria bacterium]|nr:hypothetical protein [Deltaproteobacteria bacterium]